MNKLIIDIGNHTTRALLYNCDSRSIAPIHLALSNELLIPSIAVINENNQIVAIGEDALLWKQTNPEMFCHLEDIKDEVCFATFIAQICKTIIKRACRSGKNVNSLVVLTPPNRSKLSTNYIDWVKRELLNQNIHSIVVKNDYEHILRKSYSVSNGEYLLLYDIGYTHTTIALAKKVESGIQTVGQNTSEVLSGKMIDSILFQDIESQLSLPDYEDLTLGLLYNSALEQTIEHIKRKCSLEESISSPIPNANGRYECSRRELETMFSKPLSDSFSLVSQLIRDCKIDVALVKQVVMYGATCKLPFIEPYFKTYLASNLKICISEIKNIATQEIHSELYGCKAAINL